MCNMVKICYRAEMAHLTRLISNCKITLSCTLYLFGLKICFVALRFNIKFYGFIFLFFLRIQEDMSMPYRFIFITFMSVYKLRVESVFQTFLNKYLLECKFAQKSIAIVCNKFGTKYNNVPIDQHALNGRNKTCLTFENGPPVIQTIFHWKW